MIFVTDPGDTVRILAQDVSLRDSNDAAQPVTSGLTGTVTLYDAEGAVASGPTAFDGNAGDDWFVDIAAPDDEGRYRIVVIVEVSGAQRTLSGELVVGDLVP